MNIYLNISGITFRLDFEREITVNPEYEPFLLPPRAHADVRVRFTWDWANAPKPEGDPAGSDPLHYHYINGERYFCVTRGGPKGPVGCAAYTADLAEITCAINEEPFLVKLQMLHSFLRMIPVCRIFTRHNALFFHAAQIAREGQGILFAAPSGTGKTTQAKLWHAHCGAELVCNDRTVVRRDGGIWRTYGYPLDGSEPVHNHRSYPLGAVVLLRQGGENHLQRLTPAKALGRLMPQMVIDGWDPQIRGQCLQQLLTMMEEVPVYQLTCTPDIRAVETLEQQFLRG